VQRVIAHHESQHRRLCTAGQLLRDVRLEVHDLRVHTEGLGGRVERVLSDTVRTILDGDEAMENLGSAFTSGATVVVGEEGLTISEGQRIASNPNLTPERIEPRINVGGVEEPSAMAPSDGIKVGQGYGVKCMGF
jgi:hypothetical protein